MRALWGFIVALGLVAVLACACGGGDGTSADAEALLQAAMDALIEPGMVFHVEADDGTEIWIDGERETFRMQVGEVGSDWFQIAVGGGWTVWSLNSQQNEVEKEEVDPPVEYLEWTDNPAVVLGFGPPPIQEGDENVEVEVVGEKESEGRDVVVVEIREEMLEGDSDHPEGSTWVSRVELDRESHMFVATEWTVIPPEGEGEEEEDEEGVERVVYETEFIPREELPEDFFSPDVLYDAVVTFEERLKEVRAMGVTPYWLGERFKVKEGGLVLSSVWDVDVNENQGEASFGYILSNPESPSMGNWDYEVRITLKPTEGAVFEPPEVPLPGPKPELEEEVTVRGQDAILYTSELNPEGVTCVAGEWCTLPDVPLYSRLVVTLGDTAVEVRTWSRLGEEEDADENPFNNPESIIALAEALKPAK